MPSAHCSVHFCRPSVGVGHGVVAITGPLMALPDLVPITLRRTVFQKDLGFSRVNYRGRPAAKIDARAELQKLHKFVCAVWPALGLLPVAREADAIAEACEAGVAAQGGCMGQE